MIISKSFKHGWYYWFRYDIEKLRNHIISELADPISLYFDSLDSCPHPYFCQGPRASALRKPRLYVKRIRHPLTKFTQYGKKVYEDRFSSNHSRVEMFLLENDIDSVAVEVPVWFEEEEAMEHGFTYPLTGHIDVMRITDKIEVWDYKPNAERERYASTQVYWYVKMFSHRLDIPIDKFRCGYFDENVCYLVDLRSL
jgi:hypothetical protein